MRKQKVLTGCQMFLAILSFFPSLALVVFGRYIESLDYTLVGRALCVVGAVFLVGWVAAEFLILHGKTDPGRRSGPSLAVSGVAFLVFAFSFFLFLYNPVKSLWQVSVAMVQGCLVLFILGLAMLCLFLGPVFMRWHKRNKARLLYLAASAPATCVVVGNFAFSSLPSVLALTSFLVSFVLSAAVGAFFWRKKIFRARQDAVAFVVSGLIAICLFSAISDSVVAYQENYPMDVTLTVGTTKDVRSQGNQVVVYDILENGEPIPSERILAVDWVSEDGALSSDILDSMVFIETRANTKITLNFLYQPYGGIVEITGPSSARSVNLYSEFEELSPYSFTTQMPPVELAPTLLYKCAMFLALLGLLFFGVIPALYKACKWAMAAPSEEKWFHPGAFILSVLTPVIYVLYLYNNNADFLALSHSALLAAILAVVSVGLYMLIAKLGKSSRAPVLPLFALWTLLFFYNTVYTRLSSFGGTDYQIAPQGYLLFFISLSILVLVFLFGLGKRLKPQPFKIVSVFLAAIFVFNCTPLVTRLITASTADASYYKEEFIIDKSLPSPNIYWFHTDGMLSFDAIERFFDDPQTEFTEELEERGFIINREAWFEAAKFTNIALPVLMSPTFYDGVLQPLLTTGDYVDRSTPEISSIMKSIDKSRLNNELLGAFAAKGYDTNVISPNDGGFYPTTTRFYDMGGYEYMNYTKYDYVKPLIEDDPASAYEKTTLISNLRNMLDLYCTMTILALWQDPLNTAFTEWEKNQYERTEISASRKEAREVIGDDYPEFGVTMVRALEDALKTPEPRFTIIMDLMPHFAYLFDEEGNRHEGDNSYGTSTLMDYMPQHKYSADVLIYMIDEVLAADPDAIIILQADHGIHGYLHHAEMVERLQLPGDQIQLLRNSTMSAVRIPDKWGGLEEELDPLNISRVLVDRYVGQNYELLPADQPNTRKNLVGY